MVGSKCRAQEAVVKREPQTRTRLENSDSSIGRFNPTCVVRHRVDEFLIKQLSDRVRVMARGPRPVVKHASALPQIDFRAGTTFSPLPIGYPRSSIASISPPDFSRLFADSIEGLRIGKADRIRI